MAEKKATKKVKKAAPVVPEAPVIDVVNHVLVPKHKVLTKEEQEKLFEKYGISAKNLPRIRANDPVVKAINGQNGDIVEITRQSITAGESKYYRVVK